jgi:predicted dinucleotide-binding enzyme
MVSLIGIGEVGAGLARAFVDQGMSVVACACEFHGSDIAPAVVAAWKADTSRR